MSETTRDALEACASYYAQTWDERDAAYIRAYEVLDELTDDDEGMALVLGLFSRQELLNHLGAREIGFIEPGVGVVHDSVEAHVHGADCDEEPACVPVYVLEGP